MLVMNWQVVEKLRLIMLDLLLISTSGTDEFLFTDSLLLAEFDSVFCLSVSMN